MSHDIAISANMSPQSGPPTLKKPPYLILLEAKLGKAIVIEAFISLDKPASENGFVHAKGFFATQPEEEIVKSFNDIIMTAPKESIVEMMFPLHRIISIRNLIFNAVKAVTPR